MSLSARAPIEAREVKVESMTYEPLPGVCKNLLKHYVKAVPLNGGNNHHVH
jgi:hypothetical protein